MTEKTVLMKEEKMLRDQIKEERKREQKNDRAEYKTETVKVVTNRENHKLNVTKWFDLSDSIEFLNKLPNKSTLTRVNVSQEVNWSKKALD